MVITHETQVVLILDLASDNPISNTAVEAHLPDCQERYFFRLSNYLSDQAQRAPHGSDPRYWRPWAQAVNRMLDAARKRSGSQASDPAPLHYYVAGRAGLPIFAYLGMRLSKWARITCINSQGPNHWDVLPLDRSFPTDTSRSYFAKPRYHDLQPRSDLPGRVAIFVSNGLRLSEREIHTFMSEQENALTGIVEIVPERDAKTATSAVAWLTPDNAPSAAAELVTSFTDIKNHYPQHAGLVVFIAGSAPLAVMTGRALNPNVHRPVWLPSYDGAAYTPAIEDPWGRGRKLKMLIATANTRDGERLGIDQELAKIKDAIRRAPGHKQLEHALCPGVTIDDLRHAMLEEKPHILHFSGHGNLDETYFVRDDGYAQPVPARGFIELLEFTNQACLQLVVMSSCYSFEQAQALTRFVDCAIGMLDELPDPAAIEFAKAFYGALAHGHTIQKAFNQGKAQLHASCYPAESLVALYTAAGIDPDQIALIEPLRD